MVEKLDFQTDGHWVDWTAFGWVALKVSKRVVLMAAKMAEWRAAYWVAIQDVHTAAWMVALLVYAKEFCWAES